jgi:hypothetical protein
MTAALGFASNFGRKPSFADPRFAEQPNPTERGFGTRPG